MLQITNQGAHTPMLLLLSRVVREYKCRLNYLANSLQGYAGVEERSTRWDMMFISSGHFTHVLCLTSVLWLLLKYASEG